ncbi:hypothetical protein AGMMS49975_08950 [Clostridia bacterium]|nr:hypothetical protein AGMMS49975_08950 [Clostridia bacterium]
MTIRDIAIAFGYEVDKKSEKKANDSIKNLKDTATKLLGAIGIGFSLVKMNAVIEEFSKINAQIKNATEGLGEQKEIQNQIMAAANASRAAYADIAGLTSKLVQESSQLFDVEGAAKYAELTTKLFKSEGKSQSEILGLQEAINKSFSIGAVDGGTLSAIIEKSPKGAELLAKEVGVAKTELSQMAAEGKISLTQLRDAFTGNADEIEKAFGNVDMTITDALLGIRNQWGLWLTQMDKTLGVTKNIAKFMTRAFNQIMTVLRKVQMWTERLTKAVGGTDNMFKLLAISAGAIFLALNGGKILSFLKTLGGALGGVNLKVLGIAAIIAILFLAIDDFINFMQGNDSLIGEIFKAWGIDADGVRKAVIEAWEKIKKTLKSIWEFIKKLGTDIWNGLKTFWKENNEQIMETFIAVWTAIKTTVVAVWKLLKTTATAIFNGLKAFWKRWGGDIKGVFKDAFDLLLTTIKGLAEFVTGVFSGDWSKAWNGIKTVLGGAVDFITSTLDRIPGPIKAIGIAVGVLVALWNADKIFNGVTAAASGFSKAITGIPALVGKMTTAIHAMTIAKIKDKIETLQIIGLYIKDFFVALGKNIVQLGKSAAAWVANTASTVANKAATIATSAAQKAMGFASFIASIVKAGAAWVANTAAMVANKAVMLAMSVAQKAVTAAQWLMNAAMTANPIGLIIAAIAALIAIFIALWNNNEGFRNFFIKMWEGIKKAFSAVVDFFKQAIAKIISFLQPIIDAYKRIFGGIIDFFKGVFTGDFSKAAEGLKNIFGGICDYFKAIFDKVWAILKVPVEMFVGFFQGVLEKVSGFFTGIWEGIKNFFQGVWDFLVGIVKTYIAIWQAVFQAVGDFFKGIWNGIKDFFSAVWEFLVGVVKTYVAVWQAVFAAVGDFFKNLWSGISDFFSGIWEGLVGVVNKAVDIFKGAFSAVTDFFKSVWETVSGFFTGIWDGITETVKGAVDKITGFLKPVLDTIGKVKDAVGGVVDGVKGAVGGAVDKVKGVLGFAGGTEKTPDTFIAGEKGPELITGAIVKAVKKREPR